MSVNIRSGEDCDGILGGYVGIECIKGRYSQVYLSLA